MIIKRLLLPGRPLVAIDVKEHKPEKLVAVDITVKDILQMSDFEGASVQEVQAQIVREALGNLAVGLSEGSESEVTVSPLKVLRLLHSEEGIHESYGGSEDVVRCTVIFAVYVRDESTSLAPLRIVVVKADIDAAGAPESGLQRGVPDDAQPSSKQFSRFRRRRQSRRRILPHGVKLMGGW